MKLVSRIRSWLRSMTRRSRLEREMTDELRFHVEQRAADLVNGGMTPTEAARQARLEFGAVEARKEDMREALGLRLFDELRSDLRYAVRQLQQSPGFTAVAVLSLALGIGANTAIFSLMDAVLFKTLPLENSHELYYLAHGREPHVETNSTYPLFERYQGLDAFSGVTAYLTQTLKITTADGAELVNSQFVSGNYHAVLGVRMTIGRGFSNEPDRDAGADPMAVISDAYWARQFGRSPDVVGRTVMIRAASVTIVGVTAPNFQGLEPGARVDITLPISALNSGTPASTSSLSVGGFLDNHNIWFAGVTGVALSIVGRLKPGVSEAQALAQTDAILQQYMEEQPWVRANLAAEFVDLFRSAALLSADRGSGELRRQYAGPLGLLMAMVGIVLLIACANVANLLLARASARAPEVAVRLSIGASRPRIVRQLITESVLLAMSGGALGLLVANWGIDAMMSLFGGGQNPLQLEVALDTRVLLFTLTISMLTGIGFGLLPAIRATRVNLTPAWRATTRTGEPARRWAAGKMLVVFQVALCVAVLIGAGLLVRTLQNLKTMDAGFERRAVLLFNLETRGPELTAASRATFYRDLHERLRGLPGALSVAYSTRSPIDSSFEGRRVRVPGTAIDTSVMTNIVTPEYFQVFGIDLVRGRGFTADDRPDTAPVGIVGETAARALFGQSDPLGRTLQLGPQNLVIVGVARDLRNDRLRDTTPPRMLYLPLEQTSAVENRRLTAAIRTRGDPLALVGQVRSDVLVLSRGVALDYVRTMEQQLDAALVSERVVGTLSTAFGLLALILASVGLYGVMSYGVARRTSEIGIRVALGAQRERVLGMILQEGALLSTAGILVGVAIAAGLTRYIKALLFGVEPLDPATIGGAVVVMLLVALVAAWMPARRASRLDPMVALRHD